MKRARFSLIAAMVIFSSIGLLRRHLPIPSGTLALARAVIGAAFLGAILLLSRNSVHRGAVRKNLGLLLLSGFALGLNWVLLFESYNHTTVATATLCYYTAPMLVILLSPFLFREAIHWKEGICIACALVGIILVSGVTRTGFAPQELRGVLLGLGAAVFYACVMVLNKRIQGIPPLVRTTVQLSAAALILLPYSIAVEDFLPVMPNGTQLILLAIAGIVHTGIAYALYFHAVALLPAQSTALLSYIDPIGAIAISALILGEAMTPEAVIGTVLILASSLVRELHSLRFFPLQKRG